jgi:phosphopantothenoylcysteine decarboxylase/phosphopantothenate--cysteine ligase
MSEPLEIVAAVEKALTGRTVISLPAGVGPKVTAGAPLRGRRVVVTSGPTLEPIDPVRFIANRSSGKQGHAIAAAAASAGAEVVLVSGPVALADPPGVTTLHVETARDMLSAVEASLPADIFIATAAVADWRVGSVQAEKVKKRGGAAPKLDLVENPDILATVAGRAAGRPALVVGFAAETEQVVAHARQKLAAKHCDLIVANDVGFGQDVMGGDANTVHLVSAKGVETWPKMLKHEVAARLIGVIADIVTDPSAAEISAAELSAAEPSV